MKKKLLAALAALALCLLCATASADGLARITRPTEGETIPAGDFPLWLSFVYSSGSFSELAAKLMPTTIVISDTEGNIVDAHSIRKTGTIYFTAEGGYFTTLTVNTPGDYVIGVSTPGAPNDWDFTLIHVTEGSGSGSGSGSGGEEPETPGRKWSQNNPGYSIQMEQDEYTIDLAEDNRILMRFTLTDTSGMHLTNPEYYEDWHAPCFADWIGEADKKVIKYKAIGENPLVDHGDYCSVDDGWIMYRALDVGDVDFYYYVLAGGTYYDEHITKIHVIDSSGEGAQTKRLVLPEDLKSIGAQAFMHDVSFDEVLVPDGCTSIGAKAFAGCSYMDSIYIPESVTSIAEDAFEGVNSLRIYAPAGSYAEQYAENRFRFTAY